MVELRNRERIPRPARLGDPVGDVGGAPLGSPPAVEGEEAVETAVEGGAWDPREIQGDPGASEGGERRRGFAPAAEGAAGAQDKALETLVLKALRGLLDRSEAGAPEAGGPAKDEGSRGDAPILRLVDDEGKLLLPVSSRIRGTVGVIRDASRVWNLPLEARKDIQALRKRFPKTGPGDPAESEYDLATFASADAFYAAFLHALDGLFADITARLGELYVGDADVSVVEDPRYGPEGHGSLGEALRSVRATVASFEAYNYQRLHSVSLRTCALNTSDENAVSLWSDHKRELAEAWRTEAGVLSHFKDEEVAKARAHAKLRFKAVVAAQAKADAAAVVAARKSTTSANSSAASKTQFPTPKATSK